MVEVKDFESKELYKNGMENSEEDSDLADKLIDLERQFSARLAVISKGGFTKRPNEKVEYIYCPLEYAAELHNKFIHKYCNSFKKILFVGMNPGPWGMCQTGVPFGEVNAVKEYLKLSGTVSIPEKYHPFRRIDGLNCTKHEVSGQRLWGLIKEISKNDPYKFFQNCFVYNYCPIAFLAKNANNVTPADLKSDDQRTLNEVCDGFLFRVIKLLKVDTVVAIGKFVEKRALEVVKFYDIKNVNVVSIIHPSPRNKGSNNWHNDTLAQLQKLNLIQYMN